MSEYSKKPTTGGASRYERCFVRGFTRSRTTPRSHIGSSRASSSAGGEPEPRPRAARATSAAPAGARRAPPPRARTGSRGPRGALARRARPPPPGGHRPALETRDEVPVLLLQPSEVTHATRLPHSAPAGAPTGARGPDGGDGPPRTGNRERARADARSCQRRRRFTRGAAFARRRRPRGWRCSRSP